MKISIKKKIRNTHNLTTEKEILLAVLYLLLDVSWCTYMSAYVSVCVIERNTTSKSTLQRIVRIFMNFYKPSVSGAQLLSS